jgi:tetratricopeptide (TPR) repeat protein
MKAKATDETRQRMLLAMTGLLAPVVLFLLWGLYDRLATSAVSSRRTAQSALLREENFKFEKLRGETYEQGRRGDWGKVLQKLGEACGDDCPGRLALLQGEAYWRTGQREKAIAAWEPSLLSSSVTSRADILAVGGSTEEYEVYIRALSPHPDAGLANDNAWAAVLLPDILEDYAPTVALAELAVSAAPTPEEQTNALNTLGVALYRAGRYTEARATLEESQRRTPEPINLAFMALCDHKRKQPESAQALADRYYTELRDTLHLANRTRPEHLLFEKELRAAVPPSKKAKPL